ncbi:RNA recognition motif, partial [Trifolium medium]|nr:RNA recognition motif [Trifolium medium]
GFEVCGILEDVYVPSKLNVHGEAYGFVKYSNVKDVNKLTKALNAVGFGNYRIHARVSRFDRFDKAEGKSLRTEKGETKTAEAEVIPTSQMKEGDKAAKDSIIAHKS